MNYLLRCISLASLLGLALSWAPKWEPCKGETPLFTPTALDLNPERIVRGHPLVFKIFGKNSDHVVTDGEIEVHVLKEYEIDLPFYKKHGVMELYTETKGLCERATCPINVGDVVFTYTKELPGYTPPGEYIIKLVAKEAGTEDLLMCFSLKIYIHFSKEELEMKTTGVAIS